MTRIFRGFRGEGDINVTFNGRDLPMRLDLRNHSPTGFGWGYGGSGPAQLALAMLCAVTTDQVALARYQDWNWAWVAGQKSDIWSLDEEEVLTWLLKEGGHADGKSITS